MSTTSNSRASVTLLTALLSAACATTTGGIAPDAPQPAVAVIDQRTPSKPPDYQRLEIAQVRVRRLDPQLAQLAGPSFMQTSRDPVAVEVTTTTPIGHAIGDASPVLIINGVTYPDTWSLRPNRLVAFIPDRATLRNENTVQTIWIGGGEESRSRKQATFRGNPE